MWYFGVTMTLVLAWYSRPDTRDVLHVASDSLLSKSGTRETWKHATKVFRVFPSHSYIAYCGDSLYALSAIAQGIGLLSQTEILSMEKTVLKARAKALGDHIGRVLGSFPREWGKSATLLFCGRDPCLGGIHAAKIELTEGHAIVTDAFPEHARYIALGSGATCAIGKMPQVSTAHSRDIFATLTATISASTVPDVGGCPQAATLWCRSDGSRRHGSCACGFNWDIDGRYESTVFGMPLRFASKMSPVVWRTHVFTRGRYLRQATIRRVVW